MGQPYGIRINVLASDDFDPTTPTDATFHVTKPSGALTTWPGVVSAQSAASVAAVYAFAADGSDLDQVGTWRAWVQWTVAGTTPGPRTEVVSFPVIAANQA